MMMRGAPTIHGSFLTCALAVAVRGQNLVAVNSNAHTPSDPPPRSLVGAWVGTETCIEGCLTYHGESVCACTLQPTTRNRSESHHTSTRICLHSLLAPHHMLVHAFMVQLVARRRPLK